MKTWSRTIFEYCQACHATTSASWALTWMILADGLVCVFGHSLSRGRNNVRLYLYVNCWEHGFLSSSLAVSYISSTDSLHLLSSLKQLRQLHFHKLLHLKHLIWTADAQNVCNGYTMWHVATCMKHGHPWWLRGSGIILQILIPQFKSCVWEERCSAAYCLCSRMPFYVL